MHVSVSPVQSAEIDLKIYAKQSKLKFSTKHMSAHADPCTEGQPEKENGDYISCVDQKQINLTLDSFTILLV